MLLITQKLWCEFSFRTSSSHPCCRTQLHWTHEIDWELISWLNNNDNGWGLRTGVRVAKVVDIISLRSSFGAIPPLSSFEFWFKCMKSANAITMIFVLYCANWRSRVFALYFAIFLFWLYVSFKCCRSPIFASCELYLFLSLLVWL